MIAMIRSWKIGICVPLLGGRRGEERRGGGGTGGIAERGKEPGGDGGDSGNKPERLGCSGAFGGWYVNVGWFFRRFLHVLNATFNTH